MNRLLKLTALIEAATGFGLIVIPSVVVRLLLGSFLQTNRSTYKAKIYETKTKHAANETNENK
jgi:hypothetical protein